MRNQNARLWLWKGCGFNPVGVALIPGGGVWFYAFDLIVPEAVGKQLAVNTLGMTI